MGDGVEGLELTPEAGWNSAGGWAAKAPTLDNNPLAFNA
jgi:hypothetical protein